MEKTELKKKKFTSVRNPWSLYSWLWYYIYTQKDSISYTNTSGYKGTIAYYRLTYLIFPIAKEEVVYVYISSEETEAQKN